jgi:hypothetical protein
MESGGPSQRPQAFMSTQTSSLMLLSVALLSSSCVSDGTMGTTNAVCQILIGDPSPIEQFIHPQTGDVLDANMCRVGQSIYVVFFNHNHGVAVAYDLGEFSNSRLDVLNYGFGTLQPNGDWSLFHTNGTSGFFESQGGLGTLQEISDAMHQCAKERPAVRFLWPPAKTIH